MTYPRWFNDRTPTTYVPPANTLDPRYASCTTHRIGCECREGHWHENVQEYRLELSYYQKAVTQIVGDHPTYGSDDEPLCRCTGCQIVRLARDPKGLIAAARAERRAAEKAEVEAEERRRLDYDGSEVPF
ncbi:hypothetical protein [Nocardiopsis alba]|uniref:hypothetical protein n=1 Tax=Nocardiopsis alba TaxID=53437 RepID=UPI003D74C069